MSQEFEATSFERLNISLRDNSKMQADGKGF